MKILTVFAAIPILAAAAFSQGTQLPFACGAEDQRACGGNDPEYNVYYYQETPLKIFSGQACDRGLVSVNNVCKGGFGNSPRYQFNPNALPSWIYFAIRDRMYGSQTDTPLNWITTFGTHDSFSNYIDGSFSPLDGDQQLSITDQLIAGARSIRMDPIGYSVSGVSSGFPFPIVNDTQLRMCHQSASDNSGTAAECAFDSFGRLFGYGLEEVKHWLDANPGEVITIRMYRMQRGDAQEIFNEINKIIGESKILAPTCALTVGAGCSEFYPDTWDPRVKGWPTPRQMRALGKQVIFFGDINTPINFNWNEWVEADAYTDDGNFTAEKCENTAGQDVRQRSFDQWSYIGEDRSVSNFFSSSPGKGTIGPGAAKMITGCGLSIMSVDFLYAGPYAPNLTITIPPGFPVGGGQTVGINYTFPNPDTRFVNTVWNWTHAADGSTGDTAENGPVYVDPAGDWTSAPSSTALPFACAMDGGIISQPVTKQWKITQTSGPWDNGYAACQAIGGRFWAPQNSLDNSWLSSANAGLVSRVWINYQKSGLTAVTPSVCPTVSNGTCPLAATYQAGLLPANGFSMSFMGGAGGTLSYNVIAGSGAQDLLVADGKVDYAGKTLHFNWTPAAASATLAPGTYQQLISITEQDPTTHVVVPQILTFTLTVTKVPVNTTFVANLAGQSISVDGAAPVTMPHVFSWQTGDDHTIAAVSPTNPSAGVLTTLTGWSTGATTKSISYKVPANDDKITATFADSYALTLSQTGAGSITLSPPIPSSGYYAPGTTVTVTAVPATDFTFTGFTGFTPGTNPVNVNMDSARSLTANFAAINTAVTVGSNQSGITIIADGVPFQGTRTFSWVAGSSHHIDAAQPAPPVGTKAQFTSWSDNQGTAARIYIVPLTAAALIANFTETYQITLNPAANGSVSISPASSNSYYSPGQVVTVTATPNPQYSFGTFSGAVGGSANPQSFTVHQPDSVTATFVSNVHVQFVSDTAPAFTVNVDGVNMPSYSLLSWTPGSSHTLSIPSPQSSGIPNQQFVFSTWDGLPGRNQITVSPGSDAVFHVGFTTQFSVSATVTPAGSGQVTGTGWYTAGTTAALVALANGGEAFAGYSGGISGAGNSLSFTVNGPVSTVANFVAAAPNVNATMSTISDNNPALVTLQAAFRNLGNGTAAGVAIDTITIATTSGTGSVTTLAPIAVGDIQGNGTVNVPLTITWPTTANRIALTLHYTGNNGAFQSSQKFNIFR
jgi:Divergent InlB B-repeat domain